MKFFGFFHNTISKCYTLIGKNPPLPVHSLYFSPSMKLKLFHLHYGTPCTCVHNQADHFRPYSSPYHEKVLCVLKSFHSSVDLNKVRNFFCVECWNTLQKFDMSVNSLPIESLLDFLINKKKINKFLPEKPDLLQNYFCLQLFEMFDMRMIHRE